MGVTTFTEEYISTIPPARLFKASVIDSHNLIPKLFPQTIKSIDIQGNGGAGTIRQINFAAGKTYSCVKHRIDELNEETYTYKYTMIEGDTLMGNQFESISHEVKFEESNNGGTIAKMTSICCTKGEFVLTESAMNAGKEKAMGLHKVVENYLLQNPDAYA